jgi:hypothetical protein
MKIFCGFALCLLFISATDVLAHDADGLAFDCWVGNAGGKNTTHYLRCITDRDLSPSGLIQVAARFDSLVDEIHHQLHMGAAGAAEKVYRARAEATRNSGVWSILLYSYPSEWSWNEGLPERLVKNALCPGDPQCSVVIFRR